MDADAVEALILTAANKSDAIAALTAIGTLRRWLKEREREVVPLAREELSWARIGRLLGRSGQAVWEKYR